MRKQLLPVFLFLAFTGLFSTNAAAQCQAAFTFSNTGPSYTFTDGSTASSGTIIQWGWSFGDGQTANTQNASHTYTSCGTYTVTLGILTSSFCTSTYTTTVSATIPVNGSFTANDAGGGNFGFNPTPFNGSYTYIWNYGDGSALDTANFGTHTYASSGTYTVCVNFDDGAGCTDYVCQPVVVNTTGIKNSAATVALSLYPNPASGNLSIGFTLATADKIKIELYDLLGNKIAGLANQSYTAGKQHVSWNTETLPAGAYLVKMISSSGVATKRLIKQ